MLFWMDLEMTGLDPNTEVIVEIATVVTDDDLTVLAEGPDVVITTPAQFLEKMDPFVLNMHTKTQCSRRLTSSNFIVQSPEKFRSAETRLVLTADF